MYKIMKKNLLVCSGGLLAVVHDAFINSAVKKFFS